MIFLVYCIVSLFNVDVSLSQYPTTYGS